MITPPDPAKLLRSPSLTEPGINAVILQTRRAFDHPCSHRNPVRAFHLWTPLSGKGKRWGRCCAWSDAVICPAFDAAGRQPPACMGVRGPGPDHPKRARSTVESPGCPSPVSPTVAPYSPSARPHVLAIVVSLRRHGRSSIGAAFDEQGPDDAGHLVGQSNGD